MRDPSTDGHPLQQLLKAARFAKNVPLLFLVIGGALTGTGGVGPLLLGSALLVLMVSSSFITHLNILTDAELDKDKKPHLYRWMTADRRLMKGVLVGEAVFVLACLLVLSIWRFEVFLGLAGFTVLTTLYSYNFLVPPELAVKWRLKAHWWGHFVVCLGAYLSLWLAGHFCSLGSTPATFSRWFPIFFFVSLSEYSLFLSESAIDADEERAHGVNTFAGVLGRNKSSILAVVVWCLSALGLVMQAALPSSPEMSLMVLVAFVPALVLRGGANLVLALPRGQVRDEALRLKLPDLVFWGSRLATVVTLAGYSAVR
jgi:4-hydroxybenzoate polyprenyltransferase